MKIIDLLQEIEEILDSAGGFPLTGKVIVDPDDISDILKEIREELPEEMILEKINSLSDEGRLTVIESPYGIRYRKGR